MDRRSAELCGRCRRETGFQPIVLIGMAERFGGWETVRQVMGTEALEYGFEKICELGRPDLTAEAWVLASADRREPFSEAELARAKERVAAGEMLDWRRRITER